MRIGEKTHFILSDYLKLLKNGIADDENIAKLKDKMTQEMKDEFQMSKERNYEDGYNKDNKFWLSEHYYGLDVDSRLDESIDKVINNLDVFKESDRNEKILSYFKKAKTVYIESPREKDFENMKIKLYNIPELKDIVIMAAPDFGAIFENDSYLIIDWKSGQEKMEADWPSDQIKIYALKLILKTRKDIDNLDISWYEVYVPSLNKIGGKITKEDIQNIEKKLVDDVSYQKQFIVDGDIINNVPLKSNEFKRTKSSKKCDGCTFRKVCEQLKEFE